MRILSIVGALILVAFPLAAQQPANARPPSVDSTPRPTAKPSDVESVDAILKALYDVISGPAGQKRDWDRFRSLFLPMRA